MIRALILVIVFALPVTTYSQNIFPTKFLGCNTDHFSLESDSTTAKMSNKELLDILTSGFAEKVKKKIKGTLSLQIIVDFYGNSCLISLKNETNVKTKKLNLKETVDQKLKWVQPYKKVAAVVVINFEETNWDLIRLGMNADKGVHMLNN